MWFEWRRHGRSLPVLVAMVLPFGLALLWVFRDTPWRVFGSLAVVLLTPPIMAVFVAANVSRSSADGSDSYEMTPFMATRPLSSTSLVAAKLAATIRSTVVTWLLVLVAVLLALRLSGASSAVADGALDVIEIAGMPRAVALALLGLSALVVSTWKQLVRSLYVGMSGRAWLVKASVFATLVVLTIIVALAPWVHGNVDAFLALYKALPWILAALICFKISAVAWIAARLHDSRLLASPAEGALGAVIGGGAGHRRAGLDRSRLQLAGIDRLAAAARGAILTPSRSPLWSGWTGSTTGDYSARSATCLRPSTSFAMIVFNRLQPWRLDSRN